MDLPLTLFLVDTQAQVIRQGPELDLECHTEVVSPNVYKCLECDKRWTEPRRSGVASHYKRVHKLVFSVTRQRYKRRGEAVVDPSPKRTIDQDVHTDSGEDVVKPSPSIVQAEFKDAEEFREWIIDLTAELHLPMSAWDSPSLRRITKTASETFGVPVSSKKVQAYLDASIAKRRGNMCKSEDKENIC